jgi:hypothetical protein
MTPHHPARLTRGGRWALGAALLVGGGAAAHAQSPAVPAAAPSAAAQPAASAPAAPQAPAPPAAPPVPEASAPAPLPPAPAHAFEAAGVTASFYGFVELDLMHDSTQSFSEAIVNNTMARPSTLAGDNPRTQFSARDSRVGMKLVAPAHGAVKTSALVELDFFGNQPTPASEDATFSAPAVRLRHAYVKFETPIVDVLAGQTHDLFGWGGAGFYPNTVAFLGVPGEVYHRDAQLRLSKHVESDGSELDVAFAAVRPAQRDGELPDLQGGVRLAWDGWRGVTSQGASRAETQPLAIGISGITRRFSVPAFTASAANPNTATGWGASVNVFLPIIPARSREDLGNALSATAEATMGAGIANLYTGLTGGVLFPSLPNPSMTLPVPKFNADVDEGLVTYDAAGKLHTINWRALVVGLQYRAPFGQGRKLGLSAVASKIESDNVVSLTPQQGLPAVFSKAEYVDGNVFYAPTPESQVGASVQVERQTFGDGVYGVNVRGQLAVYYFF